jgi:hypothetical protein
MSEFICGFLFFVIGIALLVYNKQLVEKSKEFYSSGLSPKETKTMDSLNRFLCLSAGLITSVIGFLTMLTSNREF